MLKLIPPPADDTAFLAGGNYTQIGDSLGVNVDGVTPHPDRVATATRMDVANLAVGGSWWRDTAARAINQLGNHADNDVVEVSSGTNDALFVDDATDPNHRQAACDALETVLWLAASTTRIESAAWTQVGAWIASSGEAGARSSGGASSMTPQAGSYAEVTPAAGDYVGLAYTFASYLGLPGVTGQWTRGGVNVNTPTAASMGNTNHEAGQPAVGAAGLAVRPIRLLGLNGSAAVRQTFADAGASGPYMVNDALLRLNPTPPWIVVMKPIGALAGSTYDSEAIRARLVLRRSDIDQVVTSVTSAYAPLRGRIVVVDPLLHGFDHATMLLADGLHPNEDGQDFLANLVRRQLAFAQRTERLS